MLNTRAQFFNTAACFGILCQFQGVHTPNLKLVKIQCFTTVNIHFM